VPHDPSPYPLGRQIPPYTEGQLQNAAPLRELEEVRRVIRFPNSRALSDLELAGNGMAMR
jgi:hypothetical protein